MIPKFTKLRAAFFAGVAIVALGVSTAIVPATKAAGPIKIGLSMALTGGLAGGGKQALVAMEMWKDDVNKKLSLIHI